MRRKLFTIAVAALLALGLLAIGTVAGATQLHAKGATSLYCAIGSTNSGGIEKTEQAKAGQRCFTKESDAVRALGDNPADMQFPAGVQAQVPPGVVYDRKACSLLVPSSVHLAPGQRAFVHCDSGWYAIAEGR